MRGVVGSFREADAPGFELEQQSFQVHPTAVASQPATGRDDPVTRNEQRQWVFPICCAHSPSRMRLPDALSNLLVGTRLAVGDLLESLLDAELERGTPGIQSNGKGNPPATKISPKLLGCAS